MTKTLTTKLQRAQPRMMQLIVGAPRRRTSTSAYSRDYHDTTIDTTTEPWPESIKRATGIAERQPRTPNIECWTTTYWRRKWRWATRVATQDCTRWSRRAIHWEPQHTERRQTTRRQARPYKRWDDDINTFIRSLPQSTTTSHWMQLARDATTLAGARGPLRRTKQLEMMSQTKEKEEK